MRWIGVREEEDAEDGGGGRWHTGTILDEEPEFDVLNLPSVASIESSSTWSNAVL